MAAQRYKDILFSYSGLISSPEEIQIISNYSASIQSSYAQASCSEVLNLRKYSITRNALKIRNMIRNNKETPFVFIHCLN
jgi:hypothetical protein